MWVLPHFTRLTARLFPERNQMAQSACSDIWETMASASWRATARGTIALRSPTTERARAATLRTSPLLWERSETIWGQVQRRPTLSRVCSRFPWLREGWRALTNSSGLMAAVTVRGADSVRMWNSLTEITQGQCWSVRHREVRNGRDMSGLHRINRAYCLRRASVASP